MSACNAMTGLSVRCAARYGSDASSHGMKCMSAEWVIDINLFISEDLQYGQRIERLTIENPFLEG
jgi:predicted nucleic acid-binding protein